MSTLVIQLPAPAPARAAPAGEAGAAGARRREYAYVTSADGIELEAQGHAAAALLPTRSRRDRRHPGRRRQLAPHHLAEGAGRRGCALRSSACSKRRCSKTRTASTSRSRPSPCAGQPTWVAAVDRRWLRGRARGAEKAGVFVDRVVPMAWPDDPPIGHFAEPDAARAAASQASRTWAACRRRRERAPARRPGARARAAAGAAADALERQRRGRRRGRALARRAGQRDAAEQRLLQAARSLWNLRQFDLAPRTRGARALRDSAAPVHEPGLAAGAHRRGWRWSLAQIVGLNLWAWHQRSAIESAPQRDARRCVKTTFPQRQRARHPARRRRRDAARDRRPCARSPASPATPTSSRCCRPPPPPGRPTGRRSRPCASNRGKLTLAANGWSDAQIEQFRALLRPAGWSTP